MTKKGEGEGGGGDMHKFNSIKSNSLLRATKFEKKNNFSHFKIQNKSYLKHSFCGTVFEFFSNHSVTFGAIFGAKGYSIKKAKRSLQSTKSVGGITFESIVFKLYSNQSLKPPLPLF